MSVPVSSAKACVSPPPCPPRSLDDAHQICRISVIILGLLGWPIHCNLEHVTNLLRASVSPSVYRGAGKLQAPLQCTGLRDAGVPVFAPQL